MLNFVKIFFKKIHLVDIIQLNANIFILCYYCEHIMKNLLFEISH